MPERPRDEQTTSDPQEDRDYWTKTRREAAIPVPYEPKTEFAPPSPGSPEIVGEPRIIEGRDVGADRAGLESEEPRVSGPPTRVPDADIDSAPYAMVGKLFFTADGIDYTGSASVIGDDLLLTAAHNLYYQNAWSGRILFVPAAINDYGSFGDWYYETCWIPDSWHEDTSRFGYDVGLIRLFSGGRDNPPSPIGKVTGYLGYVIGADLAGLTWRDAGYPSNYEDTKYMYNQLGEYTQMLDHNKVVGMQGSLGKGTSGGPWLLRDEKSRNMFRACGIHSFRSDAYPGEVFSPHFAGWVDEFIRRHRDPPWRA